jgi:hypothetical protein
MGQTTNQGAMVGTVADPSGAVIPAATITATNVDTGVSIDAVSNNVGEYRISFLAPGQYTITAKAKGFRTTQLEGVTLTVGQLLRFDLHLTLGASSEQVMVTASSAAINLDTPARGDAITSVAISNLPLNGREWIQLATIVPGVQSGNVKAGTFTNKNVQDFGFNGARDTHNAYYVDGADSTDSYTNNLISSPSLDAIEEFRVETNMYSAQYGRSGGAVIEAITKSGTNTLHGSLYEYHRDKALDARPPFATQPKSTLPNYIINQFGGSVGGAIKKNKAFFFFSMEKLRETTPGSVLVSFAPSAAQAQGNVNNTINPLSGTQVVLTNPYTGQVIPSNVLPSSLINPVGQTLMSIWSQYTPNYNDPYLNLRLFLGSKDGQDKYLPRIDYNINERNRMSGSFDWDDYNNGSAAETIYGNKTLRQYDKTVAYTYTHTFSPTLVNDFKFSYTRYLDYAGFTLNDQSYGVKWGMYAPINQATGSPAIFMYTAGYNTFQIGNEGASGHNDRTLYLRDNLVKVVGKHTLYFGGDFRRQNYNWENSSSVTQDYFGILDGNAALQNYFGETDSTFTDLLTGAPGYMEVGIGTGAFMPFSRNALGAYLQDDWKVTSRLTLNLGLRYDYESPFTEDNGEFLSLDFNTGLPQYCAGAPAAALAIVEFKYETGGTCQNHTPNHRDLAPRIGFAFRPFHNYKTVIRGGYGIFYVSENAYSQTYGSWVQPFAGEFQWNAGGIYWRQPSGGTNPLLDGNEHFTTLDKEPYGLNYVQGQSIGVFFPTAPHFPDSYVQQANLTLARDIGWKSMAELGWVGSRGINLNGDSTLVNYDPALLTMVQKNNPTLSNFGLYTKGFNSWYNSLQASVRKETSHGVWFLAGYTWSHALADMSNQSTNQTLFIDQTQLGNINTRRTANADFDARQRFTFSGTWALPFGRGKAFGSTWNPVIDKFLGGWQASSIITFQSGYPFTVYTTSLLFPDRVCNGNLPRGGRTATDWFNYSCFVNHTPTTMINPVTGLSETINTQGNSPVNGIYGPGTNNWDIGTQKNFKIGERFNLQLRGEFFNAFNHPNLQAPSGDYFFNSSSGAAITRAATNRDIQVALRLSF